MTNKITYKEARGCYLWFGFTENDLAHDLGELPAYDETAIDYALILRRIPPEQCPQA